MGVTGGGVGDRAVWWPELRRFRRGLGVAWILFAALSAAWDWSSLPWELPSILIGAAWLWGARERVETDEKGVRVVGFFKTRFVPWSSVADLRGNAGPRCTRLVLVARSGEEVRLPPNPTVHRGLVRLWERIATQDQSRPTIRNDRLHGFIPQRAVIGMTAERRERSRSAVRPAQ